MIVEFVEFSPPEALSGIRHWECHICEYLGGRVRFDFNLRRCLGFGDSSEMFGVACVFSTSICMQVLRGNNGRVSYLAGLSLVTVNRLTWPY